MVFILFTGIVGYLLFREKKDGSGRKVRSITLCALTEEAGEILNEYGLRRFASAGENGKAALRTEKTIADAIGKCCSGLRGPRDVVMSVIRDWLNMTVRPTHEELTALFSEDNNVWGRFECLLYVEGGADDERGFGKLWESRFRDIALCCGEIGANYVEDAYRHLCSSLSDTDLTEVLARMIYAGSVGLGKVDSLIWQKGCIEEIQLGMSGHTKENYDYREALCGKASDRKSFSRDSIHVMVGGVPIKLPFLSFDSDDEMVRVLRNLIKNTGAGELTRKTPRIVCDTPDGRRVTVSRPPFSDSWAGLIRKFDTVPGTSIEELVEDDGLRKLLHELVRTRRSIGITGETASGKTTLLRALLIEIGKERSIRVIEGDSFELNIRDFLPDANTLTLRVSDTDPADSVLGFSKNTTGQVFAVGEVNTPEMAVTLTDISKTAETILFTAHYKETSDMVRDFTNARLNAGGYSDERLAKQEAVGALDIDIHMRRKGGARFIERISEVQNDGTIRCLWAV